MAAIYEAIARAADFERNKAEKEAGQKRTCEILRHTTRMTRDLLVMFCCIGYTDVDTQKFNGIMEGAFGRKLTEESELKGLLTHSFSEILLLGNDREVFDRRIQTIFGGVSQPMADGLFKAYSQCAQASPGFKSNNAGRKRPAKRDTRRSEEVGAWSVTSSVAVRDQPSRGPPAVDGFYYHGCLGDQPSRGP